MQPPGAQRGVPSTVCKAGDRAASGARDLLCDRGEYVGLEKEIECNFK